MGKIKKILENELVGGTQSTDVYPVTSVKAIYDEDNERLDNIIRRRGVVNISTNYNSDHIAEVLTLKQAIAKVPSNDRVLGFQGKFQTSEGWKSYIFTGDSISNWSDISNWVELISSAVLAQELGDSTSKAISQVAVTNAINTVNENTTKLDNRTVILNDNLKLPFKGTLNIKLLCIKGETIRLTIENTGNSDGYFNCVAYYKQVKKQSISSQLISSKSTGKTIEKILISDIDSIQIDDLNNVGGIITLEYGSLSDAIINKSNHITEYIGPSIVKGSATNTNPPYISLGGETNLCINGYPVKKGEKWVYSGRAYWHSAWVKKEDNSIDESFLAAGTYNKKEFIIPCDGNLYAWGIISDSVPPFNCYRVYENKTLQEQISDLQSDVIEEQQNIKNFNENFRNIITEYGYYNKSGNFATSLSDKANKAVKEYDVKAGEIYSYTGHNSWTGAFLRKSDGSTIDLNVPKDATDFRFEIPEDGKLCAWGLNNGKNLNTFILYCVENKTNSAAWQGKFNSEKALQEIENLGISTNENKYTKDDFTVTTWNCAKTEDENGITIIQTSSDSNYNINFKNNVAVNSGSFIFVRARVLSDKDVWVQVTTYSKATDQRTCFIFIEANKEKEIYFRGTVANENGVLNVMFVFAKEQSGINFTIKSITACIDNYDAWSTTEEKTTLKEFGNNNKVYIVDKEGGGHFLSISQACTTLKSIFDKTTPVTILVKNGLYNKEVSPYTTIVYPYAAINKGSNRISIIGESKENTIIEYTNENPNRLKVIEVGSSDCVIKNLTIRSLKGSSYDTNLGSASHKACYCLHIDLGPDMDETYGGNYKTFVENCYLYSECHSPIGAGLTDGQTICVDKCKIISNSKTGNSAGALYIHAKAAGSSGDAGENMGVEIRHCDLISLDNTKALTLPNVGDSKYINISCEIIGNLLYTTGDNIIDNNFKSSHKLLEYSIGNNIADLNYSL